MKNMVNSDSKTANRILAILLAMSIVLTSSPLISVAQASTNDVELATIVGFTELAQDVREQNVEMEVSVDKLSLPNTLQVVAIDTAAEVNEAPIVPPAEMLTGEALVNGEATNTAPQQITKNITITDVTWDSDPAYDSAISSVCIFTAVIPDNYVLGEGVNLPTITVTVEEAKPTEPSAVDKLIVTIDALPTMDEWMAMDETLAREVMGNILAAKAGYDALTDVEKALVDAPRTAKLLELTEMAAGLSAMQPMATEDIGSGISGTCKWVIDADGTLTISPTSGDSGVLGEAKYTDDVPWIENITNIKSVVVANGVKANINSSHLFNDLINCTTMNLSGLDTTGVTSMVFMFNNCKELEALDVGKFDTTNVTNMDGMFRNCEALTTLDLSTFKTDNVRVMSQMFQNCEALTTLDLSTFDTIKVGDMSTMFYGCAALTTLDLSTFDTTIVHEMGSMFSGCAALTTLKVSTFNTANVKNMYEMFYGCAALETLDLSSFNTANVTSMYRMFSGCAALVETLDLNSFSTVNVTNMDSMFSGCAALKSIEFGADFTAAKIKNMSEMFKSCAALETLDLSSFNTAEATTMDSMFYGCAALKSIEFGENFTAAKVTTVTGMFMDCPKLTTLNLSEFDSSKLTHMNIMFAGCSALESITFGEKFNAAEAKFMQGMFSGCGELTKLDLSSFNITNVTDDIEMADMFSGCKKLIEIEFGENFYNANVTSTRQMFYNCEALTTLDLSNFNASKVTNTSLMFKNCKALTNLNLSEFNTSKVTDMSSMFESCEALKSVIFGENFTTPLVTTMANMFRGCNALTTLDLSTFSIRRETNVSDMLNGCNIGLNTNIYNINMRPTKVYIYEKHSKKEFTNSYTGLTGGEENIIFKPLIITKSTNSTITLTPEPVAGKYREYFEKVAPLYTGTAPVDDGKTDYREIGEEITVVYNEENTDVFVTKTDDVSSSVDVVNKKFTMPDYDVTITANAWTADLTIYVTKDSTGWTNHGKIYTLVSGPTIVTDLTKVPYGTYNIYDNGTDTGAEVKIGYGGLIYMLEYCTVTFYDGEVAYTMPAPQVVLKSKNATKPTDPTKAGYTFSKWMKKDGTTEFDFANAVTQKTSVYASWTPKTDTAYTVKHYKQEVNGNYPAAATDTDSNTGTTNASVTPGVKSYDGFTSPQTQTVTIGADGNTVVTYQYPRKMFAVTFDSKGGSAISPISDVRYGATIATPTSPTRNGYTFAGWYKDEACSTAWTFDSDTVSAATTLYAKWTDATAPTITATSSVSATDWSQRATIALVYSDNKAVTKLEVKVDNGNYENLTLDNTYTVITEGTHDYQFKATDAEDNFTESAVVTVKIDTATPTTPTVTGAKTEWVKENIIFTLSTSNPPASEIKSYYYSTDNGINWNEITGNSYTATAAETVKFKSISGSGVASTATSDYIVKIDKAVLGAPALTGGVDELTKENVVLTLTAPNPAPASGIKEYAVSLNGGNDWGDVVAWDGTTTESITISASGNHEVVVKITNNAGNQSDSNTVTVKIDKTPPTFGNTTADEITDTTAKIKLTPSEGGKAYWLVAITPPTSETVKNSGKGKDTIANKEITIDITELEAGKKQTIYVVIEDAAGNLSEVGSVDVITIQSAPTITDILDFEKETITPPAGTEAYTDPDDIEKSKLTPKDGVIVVTPGVDIYIRYPEKTEDDDQIPASPSTKITIPSRPETPGGKTLIRTDTTVEIGDAAKNEEYVIEKKDSGTTDWSKVNTEGIFNGLSPNTEYTVYARVAATENTFASAASGTDAKTLVTIGTVTIGGAGASNPSNTAPKPSALDAGGESITYTGSYNKDYTPSVVIGGETNVPTMSWDKEKGTGTWEYVYTIKTTDSIVNATVNFKTHVSTTITASDVELFADATENGSSTALTSWLDSKHKVDAKYDNGVTDSVAATYTTTDNFDAKGKEYGYTAKVGTASATLKVKVKAVSAAVTAPSEITMIKNTENGYTKEQLGLPASVTATYSGDGYTSTTNQLGVTWAGELPADFGKTVTEQAFEFTGTIALPAWATGSGGGTTTVKVSIINQTPLTDAQISLTLPGWIYGEMSEPNPTGSILVEDTNGKYTYSYSSDGGNTWLTAGQLPTSTGGQIKAGVYTGKLAYSGDKYAGTKTIAFTVATKELTVAAGTLSVSEKAYDGTTSATIKGAPTVAGVLSGDSVTIDSFIGTYANTDPGTDIKVSVVGFTTAGADKANYKLPAGTNLELSGSITKADGTKNPDYAKALEKLAEVHIVTNVFPTPGDVKLPAGWSFTGDKTKRIIANNDNGGKQAFGVKYTSSSKFYNDVTLSAQQFPVSTVTMEMEGGLSMRTIQNIGDTLKISSVKLNVTGTPLPNAGDYSIANMDWRSSCVNIATIKGDSVSGSGNITATVTAATNGVSMIGVAYKNGGSMLGYILVKVVGSSENSNNNVADIKDITKTLESLVNPENASAEDTNAVNAVADEITKLPDTLKDSLKKDDVKPLDDLKKAVNANLGIKVDETSVEGVSPPAASNIVVTGQYIACGVDEGQVTYMVTPTVPTDSNTKLQIDLKMKVNGQEEQLKSPLFFSMELPADIDTSKLKIKHIMASSTEEISFTASGQTVSFKLNSFSGLQFITTSDGGGGITGGGGSGDDYHDDEYDFWKAVTDKINDAGNGDTISINAKDYDKMPWTTMEALRENPDVALVIKWNGGDSITIPAGKAQQNQSKRIYWPLSLLAELYSVNITEPIKVNPATGGGKITEITAPGSTRPAKVVTSKDAGISDQATNGKDLTAPLVGNPTASQAKSFCLIDMLTGNRTSFNCIWCWIALVVAAALGVTRQVTRKKNSQIQD